MERFDRASTSVWTLRFPYFVGRAAGILAVSSLTFSGRGFSITRFAEDRLVGEKAAAAVSH